LVVGVLLATDVGNTNTVFGVYEGEAMLVSWRAQTERGRTGDEWAALLYACLLARAIRTEQLDGCIMSSVVPPVTEALRAAVSGLLGRQAMMVEPSMKLNVRIAAENPYAVGADRIVNAASAFRRYGGPCIVVDFGTATKFEAVSAEGVYLGGAIAPGLRTAADALVGRAAQLFPVDLVAPPRVIAVNTIESMQAGIVLGYVGLVEGLLRRMQAELQAVSPGAARVIATGGLAPLIAPLTPLFTDADPNLTLEGLRLIYGLNT